ncbi:TAT-binding protein-like protein 7, AAA ATPase, partial [Coemansia biformis]
QKPSKKKRKEKKSHHPSPDTPQPTGLPHSPRRTPSRAKHAEKTKPDNVQPEESSSSEGEQAAQYNLRQRTKPVSYRLAPQPKSPPDRYKKYLRDLREMERKADEMSALSDIEETIAPVRPAGSDDEAEHTGRAAGGDELEPILPMNMAELGVERCRRAGYSGPVGSTGSGPTRSAVSFEDVGGLDEYIRSLKEMVVLPLVYPEIYGSFGIRPPRGVLFHGPPGTGKTLLARALSQSCQAQDGGQTIAFFMRRGADCLSKWVGDAERQLRVLFEQARAFQPSIIFFDELDGLAPARSARQDQVHTSVVATLLALMDGVDDRGQVVVIGATNRPDAIDSALRRPGRFDREMRFRLPGPEARRRILHIHSRGWLNHMQPADEEVVVARTQGWGGADIGALCTEAVLAAVRRSYPQIYESREKLPIDPRRIVVSGIDIREALALVAPSTGRSGASSTAALAPELRPLLGPHEERAARQLVSALRLGTEKLSSLCMQYLGTAVFRPRVAIYGLAGMGVPSVAAAVAHTMEARDVPVFVVGAQHMHSGGDASAGSHVVRLFSEARRRQPSVVYIPGVGQLAEAMGGSAATLLSQCIQELAPGDRVGVVIAAEAPLAAAAPTGDWVDGREGAPPTTHAERMWRAAVPPFARQWFAGTPSACRICVGVPTSTQRKAFFAPVIDLADAAAQLSATGGDPASDAAQLPLPALTSPAQCPVPDPPVFELPPPPMSQPAGNLASGDETTEQRRLKHKLAEVTKTLRANRLFSAFAAPPRPSKHRGYYTAVTRPMFLNMMALKVGACQYKSVEEYMADIRLIGRNAVAYAKRCDVLAAKGGSAGTGSDGGDEDEDEETTDVADAITREVEAAKRANVFVVAAAKLCDHHVRPLSRTPSEASMPATPTRGPTPIPTPTLEPMPTPTSAQMPTMPMSTTPDLAAGDAASQRARWSVGTGFNNLSTPSQRAKKHSSKPRRMTGGIPQVVHEVVAPVGSAGGNVRADDGRTLFLRDLLRLTRGFSADALEALRVRLATELSACTVAGAHQQLPAPPVFRPLAVVLRLWHDDAVRDRCDLGGPSALGDSEMSSDDY